MKKPDIPVSDRIKELRGPALTADQVASISNFVYADYDQDHSPLYTRAFYEACDIVPELETLQRQIKEATFKSQRTLLSKKLRRLNEHVARLTTRNYNFNRLVMQYLEAHDGNVDNIADLIRWLRDHGELRSVQDHAARVRLKDTFGITG